MNKINNLDQNELSLSIISSTLNIIVTRSSDPAHFEYDDVAKSLNILLIKAILNDSGAKLLVIC